MPKLKCLVESCKYQKEGLCAARSIDIENAFAKSSEETKCGTYKCTTSSLEKSTHHAHEDIDIHCDVIKCLHYNNHLCNAKAIEVDSYDSMNVGSTECASFLIK